MAVIPCELVEARSGEEALGWLSDREFAVVLLAAQLSALSESSIARRIQADERLQHTPMILLCTERSMRRNLRRATPSAQLMS